jgi:hypothetical protein
MFIELQEEAFTRSVKVNKNTTFQLVGTLGAAEYITFEQPDGVGGWASIYLDEEQVQLSDGNTMVSFFSPSLIRVNKPITAADAGVMLVS